MSFIFHLMNSANEVIKNSNAFERPRFFFLIVLQRIVITVAIHYRFSTVKNTLRSIIAPFDSAPTRIVITVSNFVANYSAHAFVHEHSFYWNAWQPNLAVLAVCCLAPQVAMAGRGFDVVPDVVPHVTQPSPSPVWGGNRLSDCWLYKTYICI